MKTRIVEDLLIAVGIILVGANTALAHGEPAIVVEPSIIAAGGAVTVRGTDMEVGESFKLTLEGLSGITTLGDVSSKAQGDEAGFAATYTIPANTAPGSYTVRATAEDGDSTSADLTVTAPTGEANAGPAMVMEASGAEHGIERSKPVSEIVGVLAVAVVAAGLGFWLIRRAE